MIISVHLELDLNGLRQHSDSIIPITCCQAVQFSVACNGNPGKESLDKFQLDIIVDKATLNHLNKTNYNYKVKTASQSFILSSSQRKVRQRERERERDG